MNLKVQWWIFSVTSLLLVGAGISILGEAIRLRTLGESGWFSWGTAGLVVLNSGLSLLGHAVFLKVKEVLQD
ncbi:MAG: hypothetical protein ACON42_05800 [Flavobacteriaceae bacterium]